MISSGFNSANVPQFSYSMIILLPSKEQLKGIHLNRVVSHENITKRSQEMKKFLRGLLGETQNILLGGSAISLSNRQYYDNLKQALLELKKDPIYKIHYWDFTPYNGVTAKRKRDKGEIYSPEIRRYFEVNDDIFCTDLIDLYLQ